MTRPRRGRRAVVVSMNSVAVSWESLWVKGMTTRWSMPRSARIAAFSSTVVRLRGQVSGASTHLGWGSKVITAVGDPCPRATCSRRLITFTCPLAPGGRGGVVQQQAPDPGASQPGEVGRRPQLGTQVSGQGPDVDARPALDLPHRQGPLLLGPQPLEPNRVHPDDAGRRPLEIPPPRAPVAPLATPVDRG